MASGTLKTSGSASGRFVGGNGFSPVYGEEPPPPFSLQRCWVAPLTFEGL
jgi:hypothetical protein